LYKEVTVAKGVTQINKSQSTVLDKVERLLLVWINERQMAGDGLSVSIICEKVRDINTDLIKDKPSMSYINFYPSSAYIFYQQHIPTPSFIHDLHFNFL
jgi:hypothetical protein